MFLISNFNLKFNWELLRKASWVKAPHETGFIRDTFKIFKYKITLFRRHIIPDVFFHGAQIFIITVKKKIKE